MSHRTKLRYGRRDMETFFAPLTELAEYKELYQAANSQKGISLITGCLDSQKIHLFFGLNVLAPFRFVIANDEQRAKECFEDSQLYDSNVMYYPARDMLFFQADIHGNLLLRQRMQVFKALIEKTVSTIVTTVDACMDCLMSLTEIEEKTLVIETGKTIEQNALKKKLVSLGYEPSGQVELPGQFAVRGGIVDIYELTRDNPYRIEFWDDEVDQIKTFERSLETVESVRIYPAMDLAWTQKHVTLLDLLPEDTRILLDEPNRLLEAGEAVEEEFQTSLAKRREKGEDSLSEDWMIPFSEFTAKLQKYCCLAMCAIEPKRGTWKFRSGFSLSVKSTDNYHGSFSELVKDLKNGKQNGFRMILLSGSRTRAMRLAKDLSEEGVYAFYGEDKERTLSPGEVIVLYGHALKGFTYQDLRFMVMTESDIFGRQQKKPRKKKAYEGQRIRDFAELKVGDYVVHDRYGIGRYDGIEQIEHDGAIRDYLKISYQGTDTVYVPTSQLEILQKFSHSGTETPPKLSKIGSPEWGRTKNKVRKAVQNIAKELVELYAARQQKEGYVCGPDTVWQREFEEMFPYEETADQIAAIDDAKRDMESTKIMDRLICGDVGYGKTEIALRAAFKEVQESRQVVYLVPTTILAQQHYNTFVQRMKDFPVRVDLLCRFRTSAEQKKTIRDLEKGLVDIVIGTHRVLGKDVKFKNLGLLVIDEEQRFGVKHKEKIKMLKKDVDVLTLTATPIPRTLHMSLIGIRDMSVLEEAPVDRVPIQTYVMEYDEEIVREAIAREMRRQGQVYYVYNRVSDIDLMADRIRSLLPDARVDFAHGQMNERELERVMYEFINGELDVLVSTTIIETGLDISNVNTMIIHDSDRFGLSQLYQLRGRIGRSNRTAYAFMMYRKDKMLKEIAEKRLAAIKEYSDLGSGFRISMRDLELRGTGNILGAEQSGHMMAVGYDLYCKMLSEAVREEKGLHTIEDFETKIELDLDAYLPDRYIMNEHQKLDLYKRIAGIETREDYEDMLDEIIDRFGEPPKPVLNLLMIALIKAVAHQGYVTAVTQRHGLFRIVLYPEAKLSDQGFVALIQRYRRRLILERDKIPTLTFQPIGDVLTDLLTLSTELRSLAEA